MSRPDNARSASQLELPSGFVSAEDVLDEKVSLGSLVKFVGMVKDCRAPIATHGPDHKMEATFFDFSTQHDGRGIHLTIFRPENRMPEFNLGDVVIVINAKVQRYGNLGLITHRSTVIHVYNGSQVPKLPDSAANALRKCQSDSPRVPTKLENEYVSYLCHNIDKYSLPEKEHFQERVAESVNVREKYSTLSKVSEGRFHDLVIQVVKDPYYEGDRTNMWVTDYTSNNAFFNHVWTGGAGAGADVERDGDPYGYTAKFGAGTAAVEASSWPGPFGKLSMHITCWEPHADFVRDHLRAGSWVSLRNVQIRYGHNGNNLEGVLRGDPTFGRAKDDIAITVLEPSKDRENMDPRHVEALRRKRDYEKTKKKQIRERKDAVFMAETESPKASASVSRGKAAPPAPAPVPAPAGVKRNAEQEPSKSNAKRLRKQKRAAKLQQAEAMAEQRNQQEEVPLNKFVICEHCEQQTSSLSTLLEPVYYDVNIGGDKIVHIQLPFTNVSYVANVRVVDFRPSRLEDFAKRNRNSEYDILSDDGDQDGESSCGGDSESDDDDGSGTYVWEWCFSLLLEDATVKKPKGQAAERVWVVVGNFEGQLLTGLDAANLRDEPEVLEQLRHKLSSLWGNLEAVKSSQNRNLQAAVKSTGRQPAKAWKLPPPCSDESAAGAAAAAASAEQEPTNLPFRCCIKQYGVKVRAQDPREADAGKGKKWERMFGLYGTKVRA